MSGQGNLKISARPQVITGCLMLVVLIAGLGLWAVKARITGAVISSGTVEVESDRQIVQHPSGGVVAEIHARDGQYVAAGEILVRLEAARQRAELAFAEAQLFEIIARQNRLHAEQVQREEVIFDPALIRQSADDLALQALLVGQRQLFHATRLGIQNETSKLESRKDQIAAQISGIESQQSALLRQLEITGIELANQRALYERRLTPATAVMELEREEARLGGNLGELAASQAASRERLVETDLEIVRLVTQHIEQGIAKSRDLDGPRRQYARDARALRDEIALAEIRAPVSGIVYGMRVRTTRAVLRPAEPVLYLIPQDRPLIVAMRVPLGDIDQVAVGQAVKLRLSALDQDFTPEIWGRITQLSADAIEDEASGQSFYRVEMELPADELAKLPEGTDLLPGMPVEAFIRTGEHSPWVYLLKPVTDYFARALRES